MATANIELTQALRATATQLKNGTTYAWGNHGSCNCGNLLQVVCEISKEEILKYAHQGIGEWTELATEYCGVTNAPIDLLLHKLQEIGLTPSDIHHLEYLDNRAVLDQLPNGFRWLRKNERDDVIVYFETFATILENELLQSINLQDIFTKQEELSIVF
jgi:hypothetical protein